MIKIEIIKTQVCKECEGSGKLQTGGDCESCGGKGAIYLGEGTIAELVEYWKEQFPDVFQDKQSQESLNELKRIFQAARNKQKEN